MKTKKIFYIGERINPQFSKSYYYAYGLLSKREALKKEKCGYGSIYLTGYYTKEEYFSKVDQLKKDGFRVIDYTKF